jgi:NitT/TauT family transport system permease protein
MIRTNARRARVVAWQLAILLAGLAVWQWGYDLRHHAAWLVPPLLDPYFVSRPSDIWARFLLMGCLADADGRWLVADADAFRACLAFNENNLWIGVLVTLKNTILGFLVGVSTGFLAGLALGRSDWLSEIFQPYIVAVNSIPRVALVPIIILGFGLGDMSKIVTAWFIVFFLVFFNTYEGARTVDPDLISASRLFGASRWQTTMTVIVPSAMTWVFASLSPAISFSLIGVIVGEFIGAQRGIGRIIIESEAVGEASGMMVAIFVLMIVGVVLTFAIQRLQMHLLRWQPRYLHSS